MIDRIIIHGCFPNFSGYAAHTRNFATALNKLMPVRVRNFAYQKDLSHLTREQKDMVILQQNGDMVLGKPYDGDVMGDDNTLNIILLEHNHFWYYQDYHGPTIGYCVWESTRMKKEFFNRLLQLDGMFVPTNWQRQCMIEQGYPENRIWVVPEGVDGNIFKSGRKHQGKFRFLVFGRWDYRKAITENIKAFLDADLDAELILSADNPFPVDGYKSTEERLEKYGLEDPRIKVVHFPPTKEYIKYMKEGNMLLGISRAEGWNLPCVPEGKQIVTNEGIKKVEDVIYNDLVVSHTGHFRNIKKIMSRDYNGKIINITLYNDHDKLQLTPEHPVFAIKRKSNKFNQMIDIDPEWVMAKDIVKGDVILRALPDQTFFNDKIFDLLDFDDRLKYSNYHVWYNTGYNGNGELKKYKRFVKLSDLSYLLGWFIAEGSSGANKIQFSLNGKTEINVAEKILIEMKRVFNADGSYYIIDNKLCMSFGSTLLSKFFGKLCGIRAENKKIPQEVLFGDIEVLKNLFNNMVLGDGYITEKAATYTTVSQILSRQIIIAAQRLMIKTSTQVNIRKNRQNQPCYSIWWSYENHNHRHSNKSWWHKHGLAILVRNVGKENYNGKVYNFEIDVDNSYLLSNATVHNCIESIACGTPTIMSKHGGQLDYSKDIAHFVNTKEELPVANVFNTSKEDMAQLGNWIEPDWDHAVEVIKDVYNNYNKYKEVSFNYSKITRNTFSWENAAEKAYGIIKNLKVTKPKSIKKKVKAEFELVTDYKYPKVDFTPIEGFNNENYICSMRDLNTNFALFHDKCQLKNNFGRWMQYPASKRNLSGVVFEIAEPNGDIIFRKELNLNNDLDLTIKGKKCKLETLQLEAIWGCYNEIFHTESYSYKNCCIEEGGVVLDLGANYGLFSLYAVDKGAAKIYALEPVSEIYDFLKVNTKEFKNIETYRKAVGGITGKKDIKIFDGDSTSNSLVYDEKCDKLETVDVININELLKKIGHIDFIKCDIEGSEYNVFKAIDDKLLKGIKKIILEYHNNYNNELDVILNKLEECNFEYTVKETDSKYKVGYVIAFREVNRTTTKKSKKDGRLSNRQEILSLSFLRYTEDNLGILFKSNIDSKLNVVSYVIDGYTGLTSYRMKMTLKPGVNYFLKGAKNIKYMNFVIYDEFEKTILLKVKKTHGNIDIRDRDELGKFKNYKIVDNKQGSIALPLYEIFVDKLPEKEARCMVHEGDIVFDIGGSIGLFSYYAIGKKPKEVHYFEPLKNEYNTALQNLESFGNIKFNNVAVGKAENNVDFFVPETGSIGSSMYLEGGKKLKVDSINIMDYIIENNIEKIDFLKLDCEGSEYDIFDSIPDDYLINNVKKIFMEFHFNKNGVLREKILNKLDRCGFIYRFEAGKNENNELGILYAWKFSAKEFDFDSFIKPYENDLKRTGESRYNFYRYVIPKLIAKQKPLYVIETGTMWVDLKDNMGAFTLIFSDLIKNWSGGKLVTIDILKEHMDNCKELTKEFSDVIEYVDSDSITYLKSLSNDEVKEIDLFYFDSFDLDLTDPEPSQQHHLNELLSVYNRVSDNVVISVDDNFLPGCWVEWEWYDSNGNIMSTEIVETGNKIIGKGTLINEFLLEKGWERKTDIEVFPGSNVFLYEKPHRKSYSEVKEVLENFYSDKTTQKIKREPFQNIDVLVSEIELGDTVVITPFSKYLSIHSNSKYFSELMVFNDYYKTCDSFDNSCSTPEISKNDWGGGHAIQRIARALNLEVSIKPKGDLNIEKKIVKDKVALHLNRGGAKHTDLSQKSKNLVNKFIKKYSDIYEFVEIDPKNTLTKTIEMLSTCEYFIGLNGGPMHLATALDLKCVVLVNSPLPSELFLPKIKECEIPELEWLYPQNVHLHENGSNELVPKLTIRSLKNAFEGKVYPYWKEDFLGVFIKEKKYNVQTLPSEANHVKHFYNEIFNEEVYSFEDCHIEKGDIVLDLGANYGIFSLYAADQGAAKIHAFEPVSEVYDYLKINIREFKNIRTYKKAVGATTGKKDIKIFDGDSTSNSLVYNKKYDKLETIEVIGINDLLKEIDDVDFMKCDVEGSEYEIFKAADNDLLKQIKKIIIEYHNSYNNELDIITKKLEECGFKYRIKETDPNYKIGYIIAVQAIINEVVQEFEDKEIKIACHFVGRDSIGGPFVEIKGGNKEKDYLVKFIDNDTNEVIYQDTIKSNHWAAASRKYYTDWSIEIFDNKKLIYKHKMNLENKRVLVSLDSKSLGDTLCWAPSILEFQKKHKCEVFCSTFWNNILDYPNINFIEPGSPYTNIYAKYTVGCFDGDTNRNKNHWQTILLQQIATDYLGLKYKEIRPRLKNVGAKTDMKIDLPKKYVVIAPHSTVQMKYYLNDRWNKIIEYLHKLGYETISLSKEPNELANTIYVTNPSIEDAIRIVKKSKFVLSIGNGIAWLSFALNKPSILISGFSEYCEFKDKCYRIVPKTGCRGCFNRPEIPFIRNQWDYCYNADVLGGKRFECAYNISVGMVIKEINRLIEENF